MLYSLCSMQFCINKSNLVCARHCTHLFSPLPLNALEIAMFMEVAGIMKNTTLDLKFKKKLQKRKTKYW